MNKIMNKMSLLALAIVAMLSFASCNTEDEPMQGCFFSLGIESHTEGVSDADKPILNTYISQVFATYCYSMGMADTNYVLMSGNYQDQSSYMKTRFDAVASYPTPPEGIVGSYSFTIVLFGTYLTGNEDLTNVKYDTIASKIFTNQQ